MKNELSERLFGKPEKLLNFSERVMMTSFSISTKNLPNETIEKYIEYHRNPTWVLYHDNHTDTDIEILSNGNYVRYNDTKKNIKTYTAKNGYVYIWIASDKKDCSSILYIHRMIAELLVDNPDPENNTIVHHINRDKCCNEPWNLKWVTPKIHNDIHEPDIQHLRGEKVGGSLYNEAQIHDVCHILETRPDLSFSKISKMTGVSIDVVGGVYRNRIWTHISKDYKFPPRNSYPKGENSPASVYTDDQVEKACELRQNNPSLTRSEISKITGINEGTLKLIFAGKIRKSIRDKYNFPKRERKNKEGD